jgi:hypothetical protein
MAKKEPLPKVHIQFSRRAGDWVTTEDVQEIVEQMIKRTKKGQRPPNGKLFKDDREFHVMLHRKGIGWRAMVFTAEDIAGL